MKKNVIPVIMYFGTMGVGKGTQTKMTAERYDYTIIESGAICRQIKTERPQEGTARYALQQRVITGMSNKLVNNADMIQMIKDELAQLNLEKCTGVIFDGFPRTVLQALALEDALITQGKILSTDKVKVVFKIIACLEQWLGADREVAERIALERVSNRAKETEMGGGTIRDDDKPEKAAVKIKQYFDEIVHVANFYLGKGVHYLTDARHDSYTVFRLNCQNIESGLLKNGIKIPKLD